ncbi:MAG: PTS sugar transporter subunit IIB [Tepidanaerobacteraceae bacterium]|nr:PTS sugar transporter subunit IIB [Tepidanaerobacteraceae bacterium]
MGKVYIRVDDRLIHGQTIIAWCPTLGIQEIIAVDDESIKNPMLKSILTMGVPSKYKTNIVSTEEAKILLRSRSDRNRLIIVKQPSKLKELEESISCCEQIILGNLAKRQDTIYKVSGATGIFYLSESDISLLDSIAAKNIKVTFQQLPSTAETSWSSFKQSIK